MKRNAVIAVLSIGLVLGLWELTLPERFVLSAWTVFFGALAIAALAVLIYWALTSASASAARQSTRSARAERKSAARPAAKSQPAVPVSSSSEIVIRPRQRLALDPRFKQPPSEPAPAPKAVEIEPIPSQAVPEDDPAAAALAFEAQEAARAAQERAAAKNDAVAAEDAERVRNALVSSAYTELNSLLAEIEQLNAALPDRRSGRDRRNDERLMGGPDRRAGGRRKTDKAPDESVAAAGAAATPPRRSWARRHTINFPARW